jgi:hypothetical protein
MKYSLIGLSLLTAAFIGCGESGPPTGTVSGRVTFGGQAPPEPVFIQFINSNTGQGASATTKEDGSYSLGLPLHVGEYTVYFERIVESTGPVSTAQEQLTIIPREYRNEQSSPLKVQVEQGKNEIDLDVPLA